MPNFADIADCPRCEGVVSLEFDADEVCLTCASCGSRFGDGSPKAEARVLVTYWNLLLGGPDA
jgi:hypothetical protein